MTVTDQIKIIDNKIKANQAQYDLDRLAAKISALSSGELRKCEYLTGEDLGYRSSVLEQTKFDYSRLGKVFNTRLDDKDDQKEGLLKRLKTIEKIKTVIIMTKVNQVVLEVYRVFILPHQVVLELNQVKKHQLVMINLK